MRKCATYSVVYVLLVIWGMFSKVHEGLCEGQKHLDLFYSIRMSGLVEVQSACTPWYHLVLCKLTMQVHQLWESLSSLLFIHLMAFGKFNNPSSKLKHTITPAAAWRERYETIKSDLPIQSCSFPPFFVLGIGEYLSHGVRKRDADTDFPIEIFHWYELSQLFMHSSSSTLFPSLSYPALSF